MTAPQTRHVMMLADDHVDAIRREILRTHAPVEIVNEAGRKATFRIRRGKLVAYETTGDNLICNEVMKQSDIQRMMQDPGVKRPDPVELEKDEVRAQLLADHPDMSPEAVEYNADIIYEARRTVLRLAQQGVPPHVASQLATQALKLSEEDRGQLETMIASYQAENGTDASSNTIVHVGPPTGAIPAREEVRDPMSGMF